MSSSLVEEIETQVTLQGDDDYLTLAKEERLRQLWREMGSALVAFSGGVESSHVAYIVNSELGEKVRCTAGESASLAGNQRKERVRLAKQFGLHREVTEPGSWKTLTTPRMDLRVVTFAKINPIKSLKKSPALEKSSSYSTARHM